AFFEAIDGGVVAEDVVADFRAGHGGAHAGGRPSYGVAAEVDRRIGHGLFPASPRMAIHGRTHYCCLFSKNQRSSSLRKNTRRGDAFFSVPIAVSSCTSQSASLRYCRSSLSKSGSSWKCATVSRTRRSNPKIALASSLPL